MPIVLLFVVLSAVAALSPGISHASSWLHVYPLSVPTKQYQVVDTTFPLPEPEGYAVAVTTTSGEFAPVTFVLRAGQALSNITIHVSALASGSNSIPPANSDIRLVKTWWSPSNGNDTSQQGTFLIPELLLRDNDLVYTDLAQKKNYIRATVGGVTSYYDLTSPSAVLPDGAIVQDTATVQPFGLAINTNKQVWITLQVPSSTPAGTYTGTITISANGVGDTTVSLTATVLPFTLPAPLVDQSIFYRALLKGTCATINSDCKTQAQMSVELANMRDHGILYPNIYQSIEDTNGSTTVTTVLSLMAAAGLPKDKIYEIGDSPTSTMNNSGDYTRIVQEWRTIATANGWGTVYFFGWDEATGTTFDGQLAYFQAVHANGGKIFTAIPDVATAVRTPVINEVDAPVLYGNYLYGHASIMQNMDARGQRPFMYGFPFSGFENPEYERASYGLLMLTSSYDGAMNFVYQDGGRGNGGDLWGKFAPRAAYALPTTGGVVDTLEWEGHRVGTDDIRYASKLAALKGWNRAQLTAYLNAIPLTWGQEYLARQQIITDILAILPPSPQLSPPQNLRLFQGQ